MLPVCWWHGQVSRWLLWAGNSNPLSSQLPLLAWVQPPSPVALASCLTVYLVQLYLICFCSVFAFASLPGCFLMHSTCQVQRQLLALPWKGSCTAADSLPLEAICFHPVDSLPASFPGLSLAFWINPFSQHFGVCLSITPPVGGYHCSWLEFNLRCLSVLNKTPVPVSVPFDFITGTDHSSFCLIKFCSSFKTLCTVLLKTCLSNVWMVPMCTWLQSQGDRGGLAFQPDCLVSRQPTSQFSTLRLLRVCPHKMASTLSTPNNLLFKLLLAGLWRQQWEN